MPEGADAELAEGRVAALAAPLAKRRHNFIHDFNNSTWKAGCER